MKAFSALDNYLKPMSVRKFVGASFVLSLLLVYGNAQSAMLGIGTKDEQGRYTCWYEVSGWGEHQRTYKVTENAIRDSDWYKAMPKPGSKRVEIVLKKIASLSLVPFYLISPIGLFMYDRTGNETWLLLAMPAGLSRNLREDASTSIRYLEREDDIRALGYFTTEKGEIVGDRLSQLTRDFILNKAEQNGPLCGDDPESIGDAIDFNRVLVL